ncbi:glycosyltransferase [Microbulbifer sp. MCCC 1A16149]|uniref:glycosyltransferase n=1 Tax=Microbulbifer sp. MCCC 1A16149 TaxID=3411322 RepID=UPI003D0DA371
MTLTSSGIDVTFVMTIYNEGWILDKIASHIAAEMESKGLLTTKYFLYGGNKLHHTFPPSDVAFFMHYSNYYHLVKKVSSRVNSYCVVWYTHFDTKHGIELRDFTRLCNEYGTKVICPCSKNRDELLAAGLSHQNVTVVLGGYDENLLGLEGERSQNSVAFVSACYERKRPDLLLELASICPDIEFNIIGPRAEDVDNLGIVWSRSEFAKKISQYSNVNLYEVEYELYPSLMLRSSKYLMLSDFEGGPIGLMEAMALDLIPIATDTGFVRDLLTGPLYGNMLPVSPEVEDIKKLIYRDYECSSSRDKVRNASWKKFAENIFSFLYVDNPSFPTYLSQVVRSFYGSSLENHIFFRFLGAETEFINRRNYRISSDIYAILERSFSLNPIQKRVLKSRKSLNRILEEREKLVV